MDNNSYSVTAETDARINEGGEHIVIAICNARDSMQDVTKDQRHPMGYTYASADSIYDAVRFALKDNDVDIQIDEESCSFESATRNGKEVTVCTVTLAFRMTTGLIPRERVQPERCTIRFDYRGPQSMQAARTFAQKYWLRGKFLISTGEPDLDADVVNADDEIRDAIKGVL